eukprot:12431492-Karenia_brevis.AAC.1
MAARQLNTLTNNGGTRWHCPPYSLEPEQLCILHMNIIKDQSSSKINLMNIFEDHSCEHHAATPTSSCWRQKPLRHVKTLLVEVHTMDGGMEGLDGMHWMRW